MFKPIRRTLDPNINQKIDFSRSFVEQGAKSTHPIHISLTNLGYPLDEIFAEIFNDPIFGETTNFSFVELTGEIRHIYPLSVGLLNYLYFFREYDEHKMPVEGTRDKYWLSQTVDMAISDSIFYELILLLKEKYPQVNKEGKTQGFSYKNIIRNAAPLIDLWIKDFLQIENFEGGNFLLIGANGQVVHDSEGASRRINPACLNICKFCLEPFESGIEQENLHADDSLGDGCRSSYLKRNRSQIFPDAEYSRNLLNNFFDLLFISGDKSKLEEIRGQDLIKHVNKKIQKIARLFYNKLTNESPFLCDCFSPCADHYDPTKHKEIFQQLTDEEYRLIKECETKENTFDLEMLRKKLSILKGNDQLSYAEVHKYYLRFVNY